jgi:cytochrome c-type biogenesis protein CcmE
VDDPLGATYYIALLMGLCLLAFQVVDVLYFVLPKKWLQSRSYLRFLVTPAGIRQEAMMKKAAAVRMSKVLDNALALCGPNENVSPAKSEPGQSSRAGKTSTLPTLERFYMQPNQAETIGGVLWAWRRIFNGSMFVEEGIFLSGRVLTCNLAQFLVLGFIIFFTRYLYRLQSQFFYTPEEEQYTQYIDELSVEVAGNTTDLFGTAYDEFVNCTEQTLNVSFVELGMGVIDYTVPLDFVAWLIGEFGSLKEALTGSLVDCVNAAGPEISSF